VLHGETFVSAGVTQRYDFVTSVPVGSAAALIIAQIQYERTRSRSEKVLGGPVRALAGLSRSETTLTTFNHTTAEYVAIAPGSHPAGGRHPQTDANRSASGGVDIEKDQNDGNV
jgi:hypothetical protein